ncbi:sphingomyelin phosphodiesterase-like [Agrilus planipennis]|uniref:Sphingomyelin phosphodiesterase-like n=1 Tax=Agrilus planipennis TaxID=224129 RepID=A0A7F5R7D5_AGRPL|nr:sphingomyelin phosphodiesterase-like [Agrilus planipennis]
MAFRFLSAVCVNLRIEIKPVCDGIIDRLLDTILYIIDNDKSLTGQWICSVVLQSYGCSQPENKDWTITVDDGCSPKKLQMLSKSNTSKILHITDFHFDQHYSPGSNAECQYPICCSEDVGTPSDPLAEAGYWGDYRNCDTPRHTIVNALNHARENNKIDYVYFTGDVIDHRVWKTEKQNNINVMRQNYDIIDTAFPNIPVYPVLGNHEPHPINLYSPSSVDPKLSIQWVFDLIAKEWSRWLPEATKQTILKGGYYTVKVNEKFRIVALNSNVCYTFNLWLLYTYVDMYDQLQWLRDVLAEAETNGENVHILSHVPTGSVECYTTWAREYRKIINRYANSIKGIFNGHTHTNEFQLFYNLSNPSQAIAMAFNGGSVTSYNYLNSNYIIYETDVRTNTIINYEHYTYNLTEANLAGANVKPRWYQLYSFKDAYNLDEMNLDTVASLVERMAGNSSLAQLYYRNKYKNSDPFIEQGCDNECISDNLCEIVTSLYTDDTQCNVLESIMEYSYKQG